MSTDNVTVEADASTAGPFADADAYAGSYESTEGLSLIHI